MNIIYTLEQAINALTVLHQKQYPTDEITVDIEVMVNVISRPYPDAVNILKYYGYTDDNIYILINTAKRNIPAGKVHAIKEVREVSRGMNHLTVMGLAETKEFVEAIMK